MLAEPPSLIGHALQGARSGLDRVAYCGEACAAAPESLTVISAAFADGEAIPTRFTRDGEGVSPPLAWFGMPEEAQAAVLLVEDADSPTAQLLVHALVWELPRTDHNLTTGLLRSEGAQGGLARQSFFRSRYLPPDPPPGQGLHRYAFQVFALDRTLDFRSSPDRAALLAAMNGHVIAKGCLIGTYQRM